MTDWYSFLTPEFSRKKSSIKCRDRVVVSCPKCKMTNIVLVSNLKVKIKKSGIYTCFSCSAKEGAIHRGPRLKKNSEEVTYYLIEYSQKVPLRNINTNDRLELTCINCGVKMFRQIKKLVQYNRPPKCWKCVRKK